MIQSAIELSEAFVVLISNNSAATPNLLLEIGGAIARGKKVLPILLPTAERDSVPSILSDRVWLQPDELSPSALQPIVRAVSEGKMNFRSTRGAA